VPVLEPLPGWRVVASPDALGRAVWHGDGVRVLRFATDEAFGIGASGVDVDDPDAIVEPDAGFVGVRLDAAELGRLAAHADWLLPTHPGVLAQGKIAGVPAKLLAGDPTLLVLQAAYARELMDRLGWLG
jgi:hypothetical protein